MNRDQLIDMVFVLKWNEMRNDDAEIQAKITVRSKWDQFIANRNSFMYFFLSSILF